MLCSDDGRCTAVCIYALMAIKGSPCLQMEWLTHPAAKCGRGIKLPLVYEKCTNRQACTSFTNGTESCLLKEKYCIIVRCNWFHSLHNSSNNGRSSHNRTEIESSSNHLILHIKKQHWGSSGVLSDRQRKTSPRRKIFAAKRKIR